MQENEAPQYYFADHLEQSEFYNPRMPWLGNGKCEDAFLHPANFVTTPAFAMICFVFSAATNLSPENSTERGRWDDGGGDGRALKYRTSRDRRRRLVDQRTGK